MNCYRSPTKVREGSVFIGVTAVIPEGGGVPEGGGYVCQPPTTQSWKTGGTHPTQMFPC